MIEEQPADVVELRRLDPDRPGDALEGKLAQFLGFADDFGVRVFRASIDGAWGSNLR
jgi:hypothetical protein